MITWFCSEIWFGSLEYFDLMLFLLILGLNSEMKLVIFFFFSLTGSDSLNSSFLLLLNLPLWSVLESLASGEGFAPWIAEESIQWWRFIHESLRIDEFVDGFLVLEKLGFMHFSWAFVNFVILICNCQERETESVCVMWLLPLTFLTRKSLYRLPCGLQANDLVTRGLDWIWRGLGLNLKKRTKKQICKIRDCFAIFKRLDCF